MLGFSYRIFVKKIAKYVKNVQYFGASNLAQTVHYSRILEICMCLDASNFAESGNFINLQDLYIINLLVLYFIPERPAGYEIKNCGKM